MIKVGFVGCGEMGEPMAGHVLRSGKPWLIEGPRGGGKTALAEALALACNLPQFYLQGMEGLELGDVRLRVAEAGSSEDCHEGLGLPRLAGQPVDDH